MEYVVELIEGPKFSYEKFWEKQEPELKPHKRRALELGLHVDDVPVSPILTRYSDSVQRIETLYDPQDMIDEGMDIRAMLTYMTEQQAIDDINEAGVEPAIGVAEIEALLYEQDYTALLSIPFVKAAFSSMRQMEETSSGKIVDTSAFNTWDYFNNSGLPEFDKYRYMADKTAEKAMDLAIMHSCVNSEESKVEVKKRFASLANARYRNYALRLAEILKTASDDEQRHSLSEKIRKLNLQIRRLRHIWEKYAYWK